jgi:hypothetical protein
MNQGMRNAADGSEPSHGESNGRANAMSGEE